MSFQNPVFRTHTRTGEWLPAPPVRRTRLRKRWLRRAVRLALVGAALSGLAALGGTGWNLMHSDTAFAIQDIEIVGLTRHAAQPVMDALAGLRGRNLFTLEPSEVAGRLAGFPWLKGFMCRRHLPNALIVEVEERPELCAVTTDKGVFDIDGRGYAWHTTGGVEGVFDLAGGLSPGSQDVQNLVAEMLNLGLAGRVKTIEPAEDMDSYYLLTRDGWKLLVSPDDLGNEWHRFLQARAWIARYEPGRTTMDLRWSGRVVLAPADPSKKDMRQPAVATGAKGGPQNG